MARRLLASGLIAIVVGAFLPWRYLGGFHNPPEAGIRIFPRFLYSEHSRWLVPEVEDHGGVLILILSLAVALAFFVPPRGAERLRPWTMAGAAALVLLSLFHLTGIIIDVARRGASPEGPTMAPGLMLVVPGAALVLAAVWKR